MSVPGKEPIISVQVSADFAHWYGWAHLQLSLIEIKEEARKLIELAKLKNRIGHRLPTEPCAVKFD